MKIEKILPLRELCFYIVVSIILIPIALILYQSNVIRWGLIAVIAVAVLALIFNKHNELMTTVKEFRHTK